MSNTSINFRPLARGDLPQLQRWIREPHVAAWWHEPSELVDLEAKYLPRIEGRDPTHVFIIEYGDRPVGWIQWYRWTDYPDHARQLGAGPEAAGIDLAIGETDMVGMGVGSRAVGKFLTQLVFVDASLRAVIADPEERNVRSLRSLERVGFAAIKTVTLAGESFPRKVMQLTRTAKPRSDDSSASFLRE